MATEQEVRQEESDRAGRNRVNPNRVRYVWTHVDPQGRVVIPAEIRAEMGIEPGKRIAFVIENGHLGLITVEQGVRRAQALLREKLNIEPGRSIVDEFIAEKRAEPARE